jgi:hypothetical protein
MKGYGLPMTKDLDGHPDVLDLKLYGLKTSRGSSTGRNGERRTQYFNTKTAKRNARRIWKKRGRHQSKTELREYLNSND